MAYSLNGWWKMKGWLLAVLLLSSNALLAAAQKPISNEEPVCLSSPSKLIDADINVDTDELVLSVLTNNQHKLIQRLLQLDEGLYQLSVVEKTCMGSRRESSYEQQRNYSGHVKVLPGTKQSLVFGKAELKDGQNDSHEFRRELWWNFEGDYLHAGEGDVIAETHKRWQAEVIALKPDNLVYITRQRQPTKLGGFVRKITLTHINKGERGIFVIKHYFYSGGQLTAKEVWTVRQRGKR